jgi:hypothetical protein
MVELWEMTRGWERREGEGFKQKRRSQDPKRVLRIAMKNR